MKYMVNDGCTGCGLCEVTCPEVFSMTDASVVKAIEEEVPAESESAEAEAKDGCPVVAIEKV